MIISPVGGLPADRPGLPESPFGRPERGGVAP
jgi:hypothetical protein